MFQQPFKGGSVALVGAGPGDPDLLTVKALRFLEAADVVLYDSLVSPAVLQCVPRGAARICVGKRGGKSSWRQEDINALMIALARKGKRVVRLKAGDPSVFGRSGEEVAALSAARVDVDVVPGITTASALAANFKTSLTHRETARSLRFVTASSARGGLPQDLDWEGLANPVTTLILYMGGRTGPDFASRLIAAGRAPETSVLVAGNVSRPNAWTHTMTLQDLARATPDWGDGPVTIAIGDVFAESACGIPDGAASPETHAAELAAPAVG